MSTTRCFRRRAVCRIAGALLVPALVPGRSHSEPETNWPGRPVRLIVPFSPGGATDAVARMLAQQLGGLWGQSVIVDNRAGGGTVIGSDAVRRAPADGYTIGVVVSAHTINPSLRHDLPYDTTRDFAGLSQIGIQHMVIAAHPSFPANNLAELIALAKKRPGTLSYASSGSGTALHLGFEMLKQKAGIDILHVPYKGGAPAQQDVLAGQVPLLVDIYHSSAPLIRGGRLKLIALFSPEPIASIPGGVPIDRTVPGVSAVSIIGIVAPAGVPRPIVEKASADIAKVLRLPELTARMQEMGIEPVGSTPAQFDALVRADIAKWAPIVKASGAVAD